MARNDGGGIWTALGVIVVVGIVYLLFFRRSTAANAAQQQNSTDSLLSKLLKAVGQGPKGGVGGGGGPAPGVGGIPSNPGGNPWQNLINFANAGNQALYQQFGGTTLADYTNSALDSIQIPYEQLQTLDLSNMAYSSSTLSDFLNNYGGGYNPSDPYALAPAYDPSLDSFYFDNSGNLTN